jgi:hypothetical protein
VPKLYGACPVHGRQLMAYQMESLCRPDTAPFTAVRAAITNCCAAWATITTAVLPQAEWTADADGTLALQRQTRLTGVPSNWFSKCCGSQPCSVLTPGIPHGVTQCMLKHAIRRHAWMPSVDVQKSGHHSDRVVSNRASVM